MEDDAEWKCYTTKQLNRTLPFDSDTAILFVREVGDRRPDFDSSHGKYADGRLTGEEARSIYESIVSSEVRNDPPKEHVKRESVRMKRKKEAFAVKTRAEPSSLPTVCDLFHFAQDGDSRRLSEGLSTGRYDVNITDQYDWTLLMTAATGGHMSTVQFLLDSGAKWEGLVDRQGRNAVDLARTKGHTEIAEYILNHDPRGFRSSQQTGSDEPEPVESGRGVTTFHCSVCQKVVQDSSVSSHSVSIPHQFCSQHKPSVLPYGLPETNRGFQMMLRSGWNPERGLGSGGQGRQFPVKTVLKRDRLGVGVTSSNVPRVTHFRPCDVSAIKSERDKRRTERRECNKRGMNKKERVRSLRKERQWEIDIRQYMSSDY